VTDDWGASRAPSKRIAAELRDAIARGDYAERPRLPSAVRLAEIHGVDSSTCGKALRLLVAAGLAVSSPGSGTFAVTPGRDRLASGGFSHDPRSRITHTLNWVNAESDVSEAVSSGRRRPPANGVAGGSRPHHSPRSAIARRSSAGSR
jgi:DNA-binding GntR family transcriptional regulator